MAQEPDAPLVYAIPETISIGVSGRQQAHEKAQEIATLLLVAGVTVVAWTVDLDGEMHLMVRQGGDAQRIYEVSGALAIPVSESAVFDRFKLLEGHVDD